MWGLRKRSTASKTEAETTSFGYAVVGLGHIAPYFMDPLRDSPTCRVAAVVSGSASKAQAAARQYGAGQALTYTEFDRLRENPAVDAVYLALPVSMHLEFTERAAAAGKHVLCEKPMASCADEARAMIAACSRAGVRLSIAYRCPYTGVHQRAREIVRSGVLGGSLRITSTFGFQLKDGWRKDPAFAGGGSLYDVGVYPLNAARFLLGEEPSSVRDASAVCDSSGLEQAIQWTSVFPSGAVAECRSSYLEQLDDSLRIRGERGSVLLAPAFGHRERLQLRGEYTDAATGRPVRLQEKTPAEAASQFRLEAEALAAAVRDGASLPTPGEDGLADMIAIEAIYAAAGVSLG